MIFDNIWLLSDKSVSEVEVTQLNLTGLTPFFTYTLSVTAENSVSWQDPDTAGRTASITATTLEGGIQYACMHVCVCGGAACIRLLYAGVDSVYYTSSK